MNKIILKNNIMLFILYFAVCSIYSTSFGSENEDKSAIVNFKNLSAHESGSSQSEEKSDEGIDEVTVFSLIKLWKKTSSQLEDGGVDKTEVSELITRYFESKGIKPGNPEDIYYLKKNPPKILNLTSNKFLQSRKKSN